MLKILNTNRERESSLRPKIFIKFLLTLLFFLTLFFAVHSSAFAATRYVNADSDGTASAPTRPFNDPSYVPNNSYATLTAAYTAASAGDTIEFSGGTSGKTYITGTNLIVKSLTLRGSRISNFNGVVTIDYLGSARYTLAINANDIVVDNLHITRSSGSGVDEKFALSLYKNNALIENSVIDSPAGDFAVDIQTGSGVNNIFQNVIIYANGYGRGIKVEANSNSTTFNNCIINGSTNVSVLFYSGTVTNFNNCIFTSNGTVNYNAFYVGSSGGIINTNNSFIQGASTRPQTIVQGADGSYTWNSTNDTINGFPYFSRTKENIGYVLLTTDDLYNIDYFIDIADYAMNTYGIPMTFFVDIDGSGGTLNSITKLKLQTLIHAGHEIGLHTKHHANLSLVNALSITYSGGNTDMAFVVSGSGTTLNVTGTSDTHGPIDLTNVSYDTLGEICTTISTWTNFTCSLTDPILGEQNKESSIDLKDVTTNLTRNVAVSIPYDDDTSINNRHYVDEITNAINDIESAIHEDATLSSYHLKTMSFPGGLSSTAVINWIKTNTSLIAVRESSYVPSPNLEKVWLGNINLYDIYTGEARSDTYGANYSSLTLDQKKSRIEQAARVMATSVSNGYIMGMLNHSSTSGLTLQEFQWFLDEIVKYRTQYNIGISTLVNIVNEITTSGNWTDADSDSIWTRTFTGSDDFRLKYQSPLINTGAVVAGRTTDILGNPIVGTPDMGAYEFQAPTVPTSLAQYKSDGTTAISSGAFTDETGVVLKFNMVSINASDSLTPEVEIQPIGTSFTDTVTNTGEAVVYSDTAVLGTVNVTGLTNGVTYHWQARINNAAGPGTWVAMGGNPDFGIDTSAPTPNPPTITTSNLSQTSITWTLSTGTDAGSDLNTTPYGFSTTSGGPYTFQATPSLTEDTFSCSTSHTIYGVLKDALDNQTSEGSATLTTSACTPKTGYYVKKNTTTPVIPTVPVNPSTNSGQTTNPEGKQASYDFGPTTLKNGSRGEAVKELQRFLNKVLNLGLVIDGKLGPKTILVIKQWQKANGLTPDGLVGPKTKGKMNALSKTQ